MKLAGCGQLDDYLDGELAAAAASAFERHIDDCASCRRAVAESETMASLLKRAYSVGQAASLPLEITPAEAPASAALAPSRRSWQLRLRPSRHKLAASLIAVAAILMIWAAAAFWTAPSESPRRNVADNSTTLQSELPEIVAPPLRRPKASVRVANDEQSVAVPMPSTKDNVTIVWIYPTVQ